MLAQLGAASRQGLSGGSACLQMLDGPSACCLQRRSTIICGRSRSPVLCPPRRSSRPLRSRPGGWADLRRRGRSRPALLLVSLEEASPPHPDHRGSSRRGGHPLFPLSKKQGSISRPEDRQAAKAARFRLQPNPGGNSVPPPDGEEWRTLRGSLPLKHTAESAVNGRSPPPYSIGNVCQDPRPRPLRAPGRQQPKRAG